jgi:hypothetical protein
MARQRSSRLGWVALFLISLLTGSTVAMAGEPAALRAYADPATGRFAEPPADEARRASTLPPPPFAAVQISKGKSPAGGIKVDYRGTMMHEARAVAVFPAVPHLECDVPR